MSFDYGAVTGRLSCVVDFIVAHQLVSVYCFRVLGEDGILGKKVATSTVSRISIN